MNLQCIQVKKNNPQFHKHLYFFLDPEYTAKVTAKEEELVKEIEQTLTEQDKINIEAKAKELATHQSIPQDVSCLPTLKISDISKHGEKVPVEVKTIQNIPITLSAQPTNGIVYFRSLISLPDLPEDLIPYVPLFTTVKI